MKSFTLLLLKFGLLSAFASAGHAQTSTTTTAAPISGESYYIIQDSTSKRCMITMTKPSGPTVVVLGGEGTAYRSRAEAETAMKEINLCRQD